MHRENSKNPNLIFFLFLSSINLTSKNIKRTTKTVNPSKQSKTPYDVCLLSTDHFRPHLKVSLDAVRPVGALHTLQPLFPHLFAFNRPV